MFKDKAVLTGMVDAFVTLVLYFVAKYAGASIFEDVKIVLLTIQPFAVALIVYFANEKKIAAITTELRALRLR